MLNKIQNNVHSMVNQAQKITRLACRFHQRKHTIQIHNYIDIVLTPSPHITSSKNIRFQDQQKKRSNTTVQNQKSGELNYSYKKLKTQVLSHNAQYRLQPQIQQKGIMTLEPNQSQLLSTKVFGINKPKFLKNVKQVILPKLKGVRNIQTLNQSRTLKGQTTNIPSKIPIISNIYPEQNTVLIRKKRNRSLCKYFKHNEGMISPIKSLKKHLIELNQLQPWQSQRTQAEYFQH